MVVALGIVMLSGQSCVDIVTFYILVCCAMNLSCNRL